MQIIYEIQGVIKKQVEENWVPLKCLIDKEDYDTINQMFIKNGFNYFIYTIKKHYSKKEVKK